MSFKALEFEDKADAYLEWAQHTEYVYVSHADEVGLIHQNKKTKQISSKNYTLINNRLLASELNEFNRVELASPVASERDFPYDPVWSGGSTRQRLVLGVIDDGFPFAQTAYKSRIVALWIQGNKSGDALYLGKQLASLCKRHGGNDIGVYAAKGMASLRKRATHGSHVLDLFAGPLPARSRVSPSRMTDEGKDGSAHLPPSWERSGDAASQAPIVLVQPPHDSIDDPTGRWLGRNVLGGVDFILSVARKLNRTADKSDSLADIGRQTSGLRRTSNDQVESDSASATQTIPQHVVINISWGPQTGPHDGSSLLEMALLQRVKEAESNNQRLNIVLPAGNSYEARGHAQFSALAGCDSLEWHVAPDANHPQFLEVWWPAGVPIDQARIHVTAPDGSTLNNHQGEAAAPDVGKHGIWDQSVRGWHLVVVPHQPEGGTPRQMALLALAPTRVTERTTAASNAAAPHGCWKIQVTNIEDAPAVSDVHVYIARNAANMGARRRSKDSYLYDPVYESRRQDQAPHRIPEDDQVVRREGTLNGIATAPAHQGCFVIGGHVLNKAPNKAANSNSAEASDIAAPYTSSGPGATGGRDAPDNSLPTDESPYLRGIRGSAVREGSSVRLIGTSTAAPQLARKLANGLWPATVAPQQPAPTQPGSQQQRLPIRERRRIGDGPEPMKIEQEIS